MEINQEQSAAKPPVSETKICSICLSSGSTDDKDPIVYCDRCGVIVHESCYNADTLDDKSSDSSSPSEYWFCTPCLARVDDPVCALCPLRDRCGAYWPTLESTWVHVVCVLGVPGVLYYDELYYTPVDISNIPPQKFGNKPCQLCESRSGVTVSCDAGLCPNAFHISCASKHGLLQIRGELSKTECELYCVTHQSSSSVYKTVQRNYSVCEVQQKQLDHRTNLNEEVAQALTDHWTVFKKRTEMFPKLPKPSRTHVSRSLMVDPVALKNFFDKAQRFRPNQSTAEPNELDLHSTDTNALMAFSVNEEELNQIRKRIADTEKTLADLESASTNNDLLQEQTRLQEERKKKRQALTASTQRFNEYVAIFKRYDCHLTEETTDLNSSNVSSSMETESDMCSVCKQTDRPGQMIKCCQCHSAFHGDCLTPAMPAKTLSVMLAASKKYDWQCAECVNAQQEELDQCNVNVDEPRQTRPRRTNELVLRETLIKFTSRKRKREDEEIVESKQSKSDVKQSSPSVASSSEKKEPQTTVNDNKTTARKSRTSVIKQLFTRKTSDEINTEPKLTPTKDTSPPKSPRIAIRKPSVTKSVDPPATTTARSKSLIAEVERRAPSIFKQKISTSMKPAKKKQRKTVSDPMAIFDFFDDDDNANGTIELHSASLDSSNEKKATKTKKKKEEKHEEEQVKKPARNSRRSTTAILNEVPSDARCRECSATGTNETMTDCDKCKKFYHFACCVPPLTSFPKRRNYGWTCHRCSDDSEQSETPVTTPTKTGKRDRKSHNRYGDNDFVVDG